MVRTRVNRELTLGVEAGVDREDAAGPECEPHPRKRIGESTKLDVLGSPDQIKDPVEQVRQQGRHRERQQQTQPDHRVERGKRTADHVVLDRLLNHGEPSDVGTRGARANHRDQQRGDPTHVERHGRDQKRTASDHRPREHHLARQPFLEREDREQPERGTRPESKQHHAVLLTGSEHPGREHRAERHHRARTDDAAAEPDDHGPTERLGAHEPHTLFDLAHTRRKIDLLLAVALGPRDGEPHDDERRRHVRERVEPQRHHVFVDLQRLQRIEAAEPRGHDGERGGDGGPERKRSVRGHEGQRVRRRELVLGHEMRNGRILRRSPQHRHDLEEERGHDQQREAVDKGQRADERGAPEVTQHHDLASVETVDDDPTHGREEEPGQHPRAHDQADRRGRPIRELARNSKDGDQADPVAQAREHLRDPQLQERA